jgi:ribosomal protein S17E
MITGTKSVVKNLFFKTYSKINRLGENFTWGEGLVTHKAASNLMRLMVDFAYIYERCRSASIITPNQPIQVKGENYLLDVLKRWYPFLKGLSEIYPGLSKVVDSIRGWIEYLDKKYAEKWVLFGPPFYIDTTDAEKLSQDSQEWINAIINEYAKRGPILIREEAINQIFPESLLSGLDETTREDLKDALTSIFHLLPTPAAMVSLRIAENLVRRYYAKITGSIATKKSWADILNELEQSNKVKPSILGYLRYLKEKRNEAQHPDKRFTQEESDRLLLHIKGLLEELRSLR